MAARIPVPRCAMCGTRVGSRTTHRRYYRPGLLRYDSGLICADCLEADERDRRAAAEVCASCRADRCPVLLGLANICPMLQTLTLFCPALQGKNIKENANFTPYILCDATCSSPSFTMVDRGPPLGWRMSCRTLKFSTFSVGLC